MTPRTGIALALALALAAAPVSAGSRFELPFFSPAQSCIHGATDATRCDNPIVNGFLHIVNRTSPARAAVKTANSKASFVLVSALEARTATMALATSEYGSARCARPPFRTRL